MVDPALDLALKLFLAGLFLAAGAAKLARPARFRQALADYRLLPSPLLWPAALGLGLVEVAAAGALFASPVVAGVGALALAGLCLLYAAGIGVNLARGRTRIDCGCLGSAGEGIGVSLVVRNLLLALVALALLAGPGDRPLVWLDGLTILGVIVAAAFVYAIMAQLAHTPHGAAPENA
ncbi:MauE/DoxX family redox-associated membrane protein [Parapedomonas caeni]|jgi:hypothetical protein